MVLGPGWVYLLSKIQFDLCRCGLLAEGSPLPLLLTRSVIQDHLLRRWRPCEGVPELESRSRYVVTVLWITGTLLFAVFVPDISKIISVIGGISAFFIFIFPGVAYIPDQTMNSAPLPLCHRSNVVLHLNRALLDVRDAVGAGDLDDQVRQS